MVNRKMIQFNQLAEIVDGIVMAMERSTERNSAVSCLPSFTACMTICASSCPENAVKSMNHQ